jgi:hypothetical protein
MKIKKLGLSLAVIAALSFSGCGSSSSNDTTSNNTDDKKVEEEVEYGDSLEVTVERGAVYDATVKDADGQIAIQQNGKNTYTFTTKPKLPITVNGGWIDVDGDGELTTEDTTLTMEMKSYSNIVTPVTTYIADANKTKREEKLEALATLVDTPKDDLLELPSETVTKAIIAINALYQEIIETNGTSFDLDNSNIDTNIAALNNVELDGITDTKEIAKQIESQTINTLLESGSISKISMNEMDDLQKFIIFGETWKNRKKDNDDAKRNYTGNIVKVVDNELIFIAKKKEGFDSRAEIRTFLSEPITSYNATIKLLESNKFGKAQVNAYMSDGNDGWLLTGISVKGTKISFWAYSESSTYVNTNLVPDGTDTKLAYDENYDEAIFLNKELKCSISIEGDKYIYKVENLTDNETYTKEFDMSSHWANSAKKFDQLNIRAKFDHRDSTDDTINGDIKMKVSNINTIQ